MLTPFSAFNHPAAEFASKIGYSVGDKIYFRAIPPKQITAADAVPLGLGWKDKQTGKPRKSSITGYLRIQPDGNAIAYRVFANGGEKQVSRNGYNYLEMLNRQGRGIYFVVNPGGDKDDEITEARTLFYECDDVSLEDQTQKLKELQERLGSKIGPVIRTKKSLHVYLQLALPITGLHEWKQLQQRLIQRQESDPAICNPARLMRPPGFDHVAWKDGRFVCTPVRMIARSGSKFTLGEIDRQLPEWDEDRWDPKKPERVAGEYTGPIDQAWDIRNFAEHLEGYTIGRRGWITARCPAHNGESDNSLHINEETGAFKCHAGCASRDVYRAAVEVAKGGGYKFPERKQNRGGSRGPQAAAKSQPELYRLTCDTEQRNERYLSSILLPEPGGLLAVSSPMGTGKTQILKELQALISAETGGHYRFDVIGYRNALGRQTANRLGINHLRDLECDAHEASQLLIDDAQALAYCVDSLQRRVRAVHRAIANEETVCIVLDEADAVIRHLLEGGTLNSRTQEIQTLFAELLKGVADSGGYVIALEANLTQIAVDFLRLLMGGDSVPVTAIENTHQPHQWNINAPVFISPATGRPSPQAQRLAASKAVLEQLQQGQRVFVFSDSKRWVDQICQAADEYNCLALTGDTSEEDWARNLLDDPNKYFAEHGTPDLLAITSTAESGLSIDEGFFSVRIGYASHLDSRAFVQMAGRCRGNSPLHIFALNKAVGDENPDDFDWKGVLKNLERNANEDFTAINGAKYFAQYTEELKRATQGSMSGVGKICHDYAARYISRKNISAAGLRTAILNDLREAGHHITEAEASSDQIDPAGAVKQVLSIARDILQDAEASAYVAAEIDKSPSWAHKVLSSPGAKKGDRIKASKILQAEAYPSLPLDDQEFVKKEIVAASSRNIKAHTLAWLAKNEKIARAIDRAAWAHQLDQPYIWLPRIKTEAIKAKAISDGGLLTLTELTEYRETTPEVVASANWARSHAPLLNRLFRLQIKDSQSNIEIVNKLLKKLGYIARPIRREGSDGNRTRVYAIDQKSAPLRAMVEASLAQRWATLLSAEELETLDNPNASHICTDHNSTHMLDVDRIGLIIASVSQVKTRADLAKIKDKFARTDIHEAWKQLKTAGDSKALLLEPLFKR